MLYMMCQELEIKTTSYNYIPIRTAQIQKTDPPNAGEGVEQQELLFTAGGAATR